MLLSYETSSISYDAVDLIHGKFVPAAILDDNRDGEIRFFINIYGVLSDLTGAFAKRYDDHVIPCVSECILDPEYIINNIPRSGVEAMMEEDFFWLHVQSYPWYMLLMGEMYNICHGNYYFVVPHYRSMQMDDRLTWVWRHFGNGAKDRTVLLNCDTACDLLIKSRNDIFIGSDLVDVERWSLAGGSAYWWPEIDGKCKNPARFLSKRIRMISQHVASLRELSQK